MMYPAFQREQELRNREANDVSAGASKNCKAGTWLGKQGCLMLDMASRFLKVALSRFHQRQPNALTTAWLGVSESDHCTP